jgi:transposase
MIAAFVKAAKELILFAQEKIVHDRFHLMQMVNQAAYLIRRAENKELLPPETIPSMGHTVFG